MKLVKGLLILLAILAVMALGAWQFWLKGQVEFAKVATAYGAKMVCSCQFVAERELDSCLGDFTNDVSQVSFTVSSGELLDDGTARAENTVTASVLGGLIQNQARFEPGLGCTLVER
ncbi:MAG: hypothetical protein QNI84_10955 [Henriciella sp.]|nr:hypothetical protein [Henriciella sp.]